MNLPLHNLLKPSFFSHKQILRPPRIVNQRPGTKAEITTHKELRHRTSQPQT